MSVIDSHNNVGSHARLDFGGANQPRPGERSRTMIIIGADYHPGFQQIAFVDTDTGELQERRLAPITLTTDTWMPRRTGTQDSSGSSASAAVTLLFGPPLRRAGLPKR